MKLTIAAIDKMCREGVVSRYAIGGAVGAAFYIEPAETQDVDVFILIAPLPGRYLVDMAPVYEYLASKGYRFVEEGGQQAGHVEIEGWPVQFLVADHPLLNEALLESVEHQIEEVRAWVFRPEHLAAIALDVGRSKDRLRLAQFLESGVLDEKRLHAILERHQLLDRWAEFKKRFVD